ncbi:Retinoblastoma family protein [Acropora cervicornis]|uniref:Retinoblastoma family protein n=1 Tax=Acropora cervicornis TaxID=6130 RepID=A0AAD9VG64_ACRCE|nr:Retinoblastoma family protein [Acropora cervicornis]
MDEKKSFDQFWQQVGLDRECGDKSWNLWESISPQLSNTAKVTLTPWFVCTTYVTLCYKKNVGAQAGENERVLPSVNDLLKVARIRMVEFFQKMKEFVEICNVGDAVTESLTELKKTFCISSALFYKFTRIMPTVLDDQAFAFESEKEKDSFFKTCWLLFIVCKDVSETNISLGHEILPRLCQESNVSNSMVNAIHSQYFQPFYISKSDTRSLVEIDELNSTYEEMFRKYPGFDERNFFEEHGYLQTAFSKGDSDSPSKELLRFWNNCKKDPQELIQSQLRDVLGNFIKGLTEAVGGGNKISNEMFDQAKKLFYRVMEAMLLAEEERLSCSDFSALLNSKAFHVSLMACSLEVVIAEKVLKWPAVKFPWILKTLHLKGFDFFKVIESFILHEPLLGNNLKKESPVIEEMGMSVLNSTSESPAQQLKKSQPLLLFLRKVNHLAYNRLVSLCSSLGVEDALRGHMWTCLKYSLRSHWYLMKDQHLDKMILCAIYAISKVLGKDIKFKQIVNSYKSLPFASTHVYRGDSDKAQDNIIGFYNEFYTVAMKSTILQFATEKIPPVSPAPKSSVRVAGTNNFYLSPMRNSPNQDFTPRSRSLYSFGDSPGSGDRNSLSRINASMRAVHSQTKVPQKRLRFDECDINHLAGIFINGCSNKRDEEETGPEKHAHKGENKETS